MSNGNYPSPAVAYQAVHALIGYAAVVTAAFKFHHPIYGFLGLLAFAVVKEFVIDIFGKEKDSFLSSLTDFAFYIIGGGIGIAIGTIHAF